MHSREAGRHVWHCDTCSEYLEGEPDEEFGVSWNDAREQGWRAFRVGRSAGGRGIGQEWVHRCPECAESMG